MTSQKDIFLSGEGDKFHDRYKKLMKLKEIGEVADEVLSAISELQITPKVALEVGCSNGWRLKKLERKYSTRCYGFDSIHIKCFREYI